MNDKATVHADGRVWRVLFQGRQISVSDEGIARRIAGGLNSGENPLSAYYNEPIGFVPELDDLTSDNAPIGEVPPRMDEWDALRRIESSIHATVRGIGLATPHAADALRELASWRKVQAAADLDSGAWWLAQDRLADVADMYLAHRVETFDIPGRSS